MKKIKRSFFMFCAFVLFTGYAWAEDSQPRNSEPVELNGDSIEYKAEEGKFVAAGNVYLRQNDAVLFCDKLEFYRDKKEAHAEGNVVLESPLGKVWADKVFYNFETKKGEFTNARLMADPIYGRGRSIIKVRENYYVVHDGYVTTSDYDDPEYRIKAKRMDVYPGNKAVARNAVMYLGGIPVMYMPKYTQYLDKGRPHFSVIPGYSKDFGVYALMAYRTALTDRIETTYHLDLRELKGVAWGVDVAYNADPYAGKGLIRTYYTKEVDTDANRAWVKNTEPVVKHQQARVEWRHMMQIDPATTFIGQYYRARDPEFMKRYFRKEYLADENPATYALLTRTMPVATASLRVDKRVNREYESIVERLPEAAFSLSNQQIADTGFYFKSTNTASSLVKKDPAPSDNSKRTIRVDTDNVLSRPFKAAFLEVNPHVGTEQTFYSRTVDIKDNDSVRGIFKTGVDVSTKFYKVYNVQFDKWGVEVNKLRHVITPTLGYLYQHRPTMDSTKFDYYDAIDSRAKSDQVLVGIENKLQTKRDGKSVDLFRSLLSAPYRMNDDPAGTGFGDARWDNEFYPNEYVTVRSDLTYSNDQHQLQAANVDLYLKDNKRWELDVSRRYTYDDDDLVTTQLSYILNPKWRAVIYEQVDVNNGQWREQQYSFVRDLHSWEVEFAYRDKNHYEESGSEIWLIFRIKAFPSVNVSGGSSFSVAKAGSQSELD